MPYYTLNFSGSFWLVSCTTRNGKHSIIYLKNSAYSKSLYIRTYVLFDSQTEGPYFEGTKGPP